LQDGLRRRHVGHFVDGVAEIKADRFGHACLGFNPA
jgi:hypothetical protein